MFKKTYKKKFGYIFLSLVACLGLIVSVFPQPKSQAASAEYTAYSYCRSKVGLPPLDRLNGKLYDPSGEDMGTPCAKGFLAGYTHSSNKSTVCAFAGAGVGFGGLYVPRSTGNPGLWPTVPPNALAPVGEGPTGRTNTQGNSTQVCNQSFDAGQSRTTNDVKDLDKAAVEACDNTAASKEQECRQAIQECRKKPEGQQLNCLNKIQSDYPADPDGGGNAAGDDDSDCGGGLLFGWAICAIVETISNFSQYAFNEIIQPLMEETPLSTNTNDPIYRSWQGFRFIANILLIVSMLAIVYSQARGGD